MKTQSNPASLPSFLVTVWLFLLPGLCVTQAQLFDNLKSLAPRLPVGDPTILDASRGPKGIVAADFSGDGLADFAVSDKNGSVTVYVSKGALGFEAPRYIRADTNELRGIVAADLNHDGAIDLITTSPFSGVVHVLLNRGLMQFEDRPLYAWQGARDLAVGDFDGDGIPDLAVAGPNMGLRQYQGLGNGQFAAVTSLPELDSPACGNGGDNFPQPAFFLQTFRPAGRTRDLLVAAHGEGCSQLWVLASGVDGRLAISSTLTNLDVNALAVGPVLQAKSGGLPDLITTSLDGGYLEVRRFLAGSLSFENAPAVALSIAGGPRSIKLVDWDGDGWNDVAVLNRYFDRVTLLNNVNGNLTPGASAPVGKLPREIDAADFTGDGHTDLVVVNRYSLDVTVIPGFATGSTFAALDQIYPVDGTVTGLAVKDYNKDGRDDVAQLHIASGELSVRLSQPDGRLGDAVFYPLGFRPSAQSVTDINNDGQPDIVAADLGGSISYRLGNPDGSFGPEVKLILPANFQGSLFAIVAADFNGDGNVDLAAGYMDCRIVFMKGDGKGGFSVSGDHDHPLTFSYEARSMAAADFDRDGDLDLVGAGMDGKVSVIENQGDILSTKHLKITSFESPGLRDVRSVQVLDENQDGDWDLFVAGPSGAALFLGGPGVSFTLSKKETFDANVAGNATAMGDFDGDGKVDMAVANATDNSLNVFIRKAPDAPWELALITSVPAGMYLAAGDLDGDGKADLVGSGDVLWTALSSRRTRIVAAQSDSLGHGTADGVVINEFLASNVALPLDLDGGRTSDWVELYNGSSQPVSIVGWTFQLVREVGGGVLTTNRFLLPSTAILPQKGRLMLVAADKKRTPLHTNFTLPAEGGTLELLDKQGKLVDRIEYPAQEVDQSYSRFRDGSSGWVMNPYPSPNRMNLDNGTLDPKASFEGVDPSTLLPEVPIRFFAKGRDDLGITTVTLFWRRTDVADLVDHRAILFDDGLHQDGASQDGVFSGTLDQGLPPGARIQFYLAATDLTDKTIYLPSKPQESLAVADPDLYTASISKVKPTLEISEVVPSNKVSLTDDAGKNPDWVEIRNRGVQSVDLTDFQLARKPYGGERYRFPKGLSIAAGEYVVVFCDGGRTPGIWHATFDLDPDADEIYLIREINGSLEVIDSTRFVSIPQDKAWARGNNFAFTIANPTPYIGNVPGVTVSLVQGDPVLSLRTRVGEIYQVEEAESLSAPSWKPLLQGVVGDGRDRNLALPKGGQRFYRARQ